jgi:hypothetical protein
VSNIGLVIQQQLQQLVTLTTDHAKLCTNIQTKTSTALQQSTEDWIPAARSSGEFPLLSTQLTSAPASNSKSHSLTDPIRAATNNGVSPSRSAQFTSAPRSIKLPATTICQWI